MSQLPEEFRRGEEACGSSGPDVGSAAGGQIRGGSIAMSIGSIVLSQVFGGIREALALPPFTAVKRLLTAFCF